MSRSNDRSEKNEAVREKKTVLFVCFFNSVRSPIAEGLLRDRCGDRYTVFSAGVAPTRLNPHTIKVMQETGIDISSHIPTSIYQYRTTDFDYVVSLCDIARPIVDGMLSPKNKGFHKGFVSPSEIGRDPEEIVEDFRNLKNEIDTYLSEIFPECPQRNQK